MDFIEIVYKYGHEWHNEVIIDVKRNLEIVMNKLSAIDVNVLKPEFGYLVWIKLEGFDDIDKFVIELASETGVLVETGSRFVSNFEGYIRINLATDRVLLTVAIDKFVTYYKKRRKNEKSNNK